MNTKSYKKEYILFMKKFDTYFYNSASFLKFIEDAVLSLPGTCIKYYNDHCETCGSIPFQRKVKKYSEKVILTGLHELLRRDSETHYTNLIQISNKDETYAHWYREIEDSEFEDKFEDAIGLCLKVVSEKIDDQDLKKFVEKKIFDEQKFLFQIAKFHKWIEVQKDQEKSRKQRSIKNKKGRMEHLKRLKAREDAKEDAKKDTKELGI